MKLVLIFVFLAIYVANTQAVNCRGRPLQQSCDDVKDKGHSNLVRCKANSNNRMWYYDKSKHGCRFLNFGGCGGNNNRYCSKADCDSKCNA
ncbi:hypothetical protein ACLKA7_016293 [Drosophila subpalustris]